MTPKRVLDTRNGTGTGGIVGTVGPDSSALLDASGITGNPSISATALVLNVTVANPTAASYLTIFPHGYGQPATSNLNFTAGQTISNMVTVQVGAGVIDFHNFIGNTNIVADLFGYYTVDQSASGLSTMAPVRILSTRTGTGTGGVVAPLGSGKTLSLKVDGVAGVPTANVSAVVMNVTVTRSTAGGYVTVFPDGSAGPVSTSNLNFVAGQTIANVVIVPVGADGKVDFYNLAGTVDVIADISGYYTTPQAGVTQHGGVYNTEGPDRILNTIAGTGTNGTIAPLGSNSTLSLQVDHLPDLPVGHVRAVILDVTVTHSTAGGYVTVFPDGASGPITTSNVNFTAGQTAANMVVVPVGADGKVDFYNLAGTVDVLADILGYYTSGEALNISPAGFTTPTVDASVGGASVTVNWTVTDSNPSATGVAGDVAIRQAGATPNTYVGQTHVVQYGLDETGCCDQQADYVSGDAASSNYTYTFPVPHYAGTQTVRWVITLMTAQDDGADTLVVAGADLNSPADVVTATELVDTTALINQTLSFWNSNNPAPPYVYDGVDSEARFQLDAQDDSIASSGFWKGSLILGGPGGRTLTSTFTQISVDSQESSGSDCQGDDHEQICFVDVVVPKGTAAGTWSISQLTLTDNAGHTTTIDEHGAVPVVVGNDVTFHASGFTATPNPVNNWQATQTVQLSMTVTGAVQGVSAVYVDGDGDSQGNCVQLSTTPTVNPNGTVSVPLRFDTFTSHCVVGGIAVVDGAGDVALYGHDYQAPDPGVTINQLPDTTPPAVTSAALSPTTVTQSASNQTAFHVTAHATTGVAPLKSCSPAFYDSAGNQAQSFDDGFTMAADGTLTCASILISPAPSGAYTVGITLTDGGRLTTSYGTPTSQPMPGGPLLLTVTAG